MPTFPRMDTAEPGFAPLGREPGSPSDPSAAAEPGLADRVAELTAFARHLLDAELDLAKLRVRRVAGWAALGMLGLAAATAAAATAVVLLLSGVAQGLARLFPAEPWLGNVAAGVAVLGVIFGGAFAGRSVWDRAARRGTIRKYEERGHDERVRFGRNVAEAGKAD